MQNSGRQQQHQQTTPGGNSKGHRLEMSDYCALHHAQRTSLLSDISTGMPLLQHWLLLVSAACFEVDSGPHRLLTQPIAAKDKS